MPNHEDRAEIDALAAAFFDAFTMRDNGGADVDRLYRLFIPEALIVKNVGAVTERYGVAEFVEPRRELLSSGRIQGFREEETAAHTELFGNVAQRFSYYRKSWTADGCACQGSGAKAIQLVRTPEGWRISALAWDDLDP